MARTKQTNRGNLGSSSYDIRRMIGGKRPLIIRYSDERTIGKIRSTPPDLTVVVGSGDNREEFECYKIGMCFACPYFDGELYSFFFVHPILFVCTAILINTQFIIILIIAIIYL